MRRRVVVTGVGLVGPLGTDRDEIVSQVLGGTSVIRAVESGREGVRARVLVGLADWRPEEHIAPARRLAMDPVAQMGEHAARLALEDAGLVEAGVELPVEATQVAGAGVYLGCGLGGAWSYADGYHRYHTRDRRRLSPTTVPRVMPNAVAAHISMGFGIRGPSHTWSVACTSSATALGEAHRAIRDGYLECAVAGGAEAMLSAPVIIAWESMGVLAREHPDGPAASVRPFDAARTGFALAEGAAILVLECADRARARGARILGEICGYGATSDAHRLTEPAVDGQRRAMQAALADAGAAPESIGYVNAHATGTQVGDVVEVAAIREAFGSHAARLAVSSTKGAHGHLVGASGAFEAALTLLSLRRDRLLPTANLADPDPGCDLDLVAATDRSAAGVEYALCNSFGFGGANASLILRRGD